MVEPYTVIQISGATNLLFFILILASCRCMGVWPITKGLMGDALFQRFYKRHCLYWWGFILSVLIHTFTAMYYL